MTGDGGCRVGSGSGSGSISQSECPFFECPFVSVIRRHERIQRVLIYLVVVDQE